MKWYYYIRYASESKGNKTSRRKAKQDLIRGKEPQPKYVTGKFWND